MNDGVTVFPLLLCNYVSVANIYMLNASIQMVWICLDDRLSSSRCLV